MELERTERAGWSSHKGTGSGESKLTHTKTGTKRFTEVHKLVSHQSLDKNDGLSLMVSHFSGLAAQYNRQDPPQAS